MENSSDRQMHGESNVWSTAQTEGSMVRAMCEVQLRQRDVWSTAQTEGSMVRTMCEA